MHVKTITASGVKTRYLEAGRPGAPPIVFIHAGLMSDGGFCHNAFAWELNFPKLSEEFHVLAFDRLGHGGSISVESDAVETWDASVDHASSFLDAVGVETAHLVGHDEGAVLAVRLAFQSCDRVASCTIVNSPALAPSGDGLNKLTLAAMPHPLYGPRSQRWVLERTSYTDHHIGVGRYLDEAVVTAGQGAFAALRDRQARPDVRDRLARSVGRTKSEIYGLLNTRGFPVPALIIYGDADPLSHIPHGAEWNLAALHRPSAYARSLFDVFAKKQSKVQMKLMGRAGYMPFRERPDRFNAMLSSFVAGLEATRSHVARAS